MRRPASAVERTTRRRLNDPWTPYQDYGHNHWKNSLFYGEGISDFAIMGPGVIYGKGLSHGSRITDLRGGYTPFRAEQAGVGNKAIALKNCHNVLLRDFSILEGWTLCAARDRRR